MNGPSLPVVIKVVDTRQAESPGRKPVDDHRRQFLARVQLQEGTLAVHVREAVKKRFAPHEGLVLEALNIEFQHRRAHEVAG